MKAKLFMGDKLVAELADIEIELGPPVLRFHAPTCESVRCRERRARTCPCCRRKVHECLDAWVDGMLVCAHCKARVEAGDNGAHIAQCVACERFFLVAEEPIGVVLCRQCPPREGRS